MSPKWGSRPGKKKLDNFKNSCYNKYVRLRGNKPSPSCGRGGTADTGDLKPPAARRASSNLAARTSAVI